MQDSRDSEVTCPACGKWMAVPHELLGKTAACPACGHALTFPRPFREPESPERSIRLEVADDEPRRYGDRLSDAFDEGVARLLGRSPRRRTGRRRPAWDAQRIACAVVSSLGVLGILASFAMDTSVPVDGVGRVHNLGLMQEQQMLLALSFAAAGGGFIGELLLRRRD
jgi:hypothetical protein